MHYNKLFSCSNNKVKKMWNFVRAEINKQRNNYELTLNTERKTVRDFQELACIFNDYFIKATHSFQAENIANTSPALDLLNSVCTKSFPWINLTPVTAKEIMSIIKSLKCKNSCGCHEMPPIILKISLPYIISPLIYLCNKSMTLGIFPSWLKFSKVVPIFKNGNKDTLSNYRPILLQTSHSRISEKVIYKRLDNYMM